ncbi:hypothetical protein G6011_04051 [Alternaria panax]|uniref:Uncharacterized protein n=1 Tax=Alternaria panax TaxID=48097 RepID=A0AAD4NS34_9PLEO|nr:hypothetical protein G6011_04051 [Alternaria panax]
MKGHSVLLLAFVAAFASALPSPDAPSTSSLATSSTPPVDAEEASDLDNTLPSASDDESPGKVPTDDDLMAELQTIAGSNTTWPNISYSGVGASTDNDVETLTNQNKMKHLKGWYRVDIRMGLYGTNVGTFKGERLYNRIYELLKRCKRGASLEDCSIRNVVHNDGGDEGDTYRTDSSLYMNILESTINTRIEGLEDLTYRMMARAFQKMTEVPTNCYKPRIWDLPGHQPKGDKDHVFCNVATQVMIAYPVNGGPMQSLLKVTLENDHETDQKNYQCDEIHQSNTIMDWVSQPFLNDYYLLGGKRQDAFKKEIAALQGWKANRIAPYTSCLWDRCFDTHKDTYEPRHAWIETDDCEPNWNPIGCDPGAASRSKKELNCPPEYRGTRSYTHGKVNQREDPDSPHWIDGTP